MQLPDNEIFKPEPTESLTPDGKNTNLNTEMTDVELERNVSAVVEALTEAMQDKKIQEWCSVEGNIDLISHKEPAQGDGIPDHPDYRLRYYHLFFHWKHAEKYLMINIGTSLASNHKVNYYHLYNNQYLINEWQDKEAVQIRDNETLRHLVKIRLLTPELIHKMVALKKRIKPVSRRDEQADALIKYRGLGEAHDTLNSIYYELKERLQNDQYTYKDRKSVDNSDEYVIELLQRLDKLHQIVGTASEKLLAAKHNEQYEVEDTSLNMYVQNSINNPVGEIQKIENKMIEITKLLEEYEKILNLEIKLSIEQFMQDIWLLDDDRLKELMTFNSSIDVLNSIYQRSDPDQLDQSSLFAIKIAQHIATYRPIAIVEMIESRIQRLAEIREILFQKHYNPGQLIEALEELKLMGIKTFSLADTSTASATFPIPSYSVERVLERVKHILKYPNPISRKLMQISHLPDRFNLWDKVEELVNEMISNRNELIHQPPSSLNHGVRKVWTGFTGDVRELTTGVRKGAAKLLPKSIRKRLPKPPDDSKK